MKEITLINSVEVALVDDDFYSIIVKHRWYFDRGYAVTGAGNRHTNQKMHQLVMGPSLNFEIDHIDGKPLNNQKSNLRFCTHSQNMAKANIRSDNTTGYRGVYYHMPNSKYIAQIRVNSKTIYLGSFKSPHDAAICYNNASLKYFGVFGYQNKIEIPCEIQKLNLT